MRRPSRKDLAECFPTHGKFRYGPRPDQETMFCAIGGGVMIGGVMILEAPTGIGKTPVEYATLKAVLRYSDGPVFWITPTKALVDQCKKDYPDVHAIYGSNECPCMFAAEGFDPETPEPIPPERLVELYHDGSVPRRDQVPCIILDPCPHRVDLTTGQTVGKGATRCPFYDQLYAAKQGGIVLSTMSFYLFTQLFGRHFDTPAALVIDEAHRIADVIRYSLSFDITDWHLKQVIEMLDRIEAKEAASIGKFLQELRRIAKARQREPYEEHLLSEPEIERFVAILEGIDRKALKEKIKLAVGRRVLQPKQDYTTIKKLETLVDEIPQYIKGLKLSVETEKHRPLNYVCAFYKTETGETGKMQYKLVIHCHYVAPLVRKCLLAPFTLACSATIGKPEVFGWDSGIEGEFFRMLSPFPVDHTRLYLPSDVQDLSFQEQGSKRNKTRTIRTIARACKQFARKGHRSLVVVISNEERQKFTEFAREEGLDVISYGNGVHAKDAALVFREGDGDVLVGTAANYGEGLDLPRQIAPVIFFLRPGYPNPNSAAAQFEERRFTLSRVWKVRRWRVMLQALQVRGRNVRGPRDLGVTFFMSKQFRPILSGALPQWLEPAYRGDLAFDEAVADASKLLS